MPLNSHFFYRCIVSTDFMLQKPLASTTVTTSRPPDLIDHSGVPSPSLKHSFMMTSQMYIQPGFRQSTPEPYIDYRQELNEDIQSESQMTSAQQSAFVRHLQEIEQAAVESARNMVCVWV